MRQFIRHPADIPIEVSARRERPPSLRHSCNISMGGLSFESDIQMPPGSIVDVRIPFVRPPFETRARVVWCTPHEEHYELGVEFLDPDDAFRARMVEQICHIEHYRKIVFETEGRVLSAEEAALEWIGKYAAKFPEPDQHH